MNSSLEILNIMERVHNCIDSEAVSAISEFLYANFEEERGGFMNRYGKSDLYYTSFGLACADAMNLKLSSKKLDDYLKSQPVEQFDLIHLSCFIRSVLYLRKQKLPKFISVKSLPTLFRRVKETELIANFECENGYRMDSTKGVTPYAIFLAVSSLFNGGVAIENASQLIEKLTEFRVGSCGWSNLSNSNVSSVNATTAAMVAIYDCGGQVDDSAFDWLWSQYDENIGGFYATPGSPIPDLLSTASALLALHLFKRSIPNNVRKKCFEFVTDHWCDDGGFCGTVADGISDCEYTFYGLLSIGVLSR